MVDDLNLRVGVVIVPTVREADGLAKSSRNVYLDPQQRAAAPVLYRALTQATEQYAQGTRDASTLRTVMRQTISEQPLAQIEYVSVADPRRLTEIEGEIKDGALLSLAVRFGATRLIDNVVVE
jgi:pantoate--beta-alanine ligase